MNWNNFIPYIKMFLRYLQICGAYERTKYSILGDINRKRAFERSHRMGFCAFYESWMDASYPSEPELGSY